jgi:hypothetical protein
MQARNRRRHGRRSAARLHAGELGIELGDAPVPGRDGLRDVLV